MMLGFQPPLQLEYGHVTGLGQSDAPSWTWRESILPLSRDSSSRQVTSLSCSESSMAPHCLRIKTTFLPMSHENLTSPGPSPPQFSSHMAVPQPSSTP